MWELWALAGFIVTGFGTAIFMALYKDGIFPVMRKTKTPQVTVIRQENSGVNIEKLAIKIATAVAEQMSEKLVDKLRELQYHEPRQAVTDKDGQVIEMDESIIPIAIEAAAEYTNLEGMAEEAEHEDKDLEASKGKLASLFQKKKG